MIAGSSGLIGTALRLRFAADRRQVVRIVRDEAGPGDIGRDPATGMGGFHPTVLALGYVRLSAAIRQLPRDACSVIRYRRSGPARWDITSSPR